MSVSLTCQAPGCEATIVGASEAIALALFNSHMLHHSTNHLANANLEANSKQKAPKMDRPRIGSDVSEEEWNNFSRRWNLFRRCTDMQPAEITAQLFLCCEEDLGDQLLKEDPTAADGTHETLFNAIKRLAVIPVAVSVRRADLLQMRQAHGENIRSFYSKIKGKAATCNYSIKCHCNPPSTVDFTDIIIRDVVVAGLADVDIRKEVLGWTELDNAPITDAIAFIESKEMARNALVGSSSTTATAGISNFKKQKGAPLQPKDSHKTGKCPDCHNQFQLYSESARGGWNTKPHRLCLECWKKQRSRPSQKTRSSTVESETSGLIMKIGGLTITSSQGDHSSMSLTAVSQVKPVKRSIDLNHHIFTDQGWVTAHSMTHPTIPLRMTTKKEDYDAFGVAFLLTRHTSL